MDQPRQFRLGRRPAAVFLLAKTRAPHATLSTADNGLDNIGEIVMNTIVI